MTDQPHYPYADGDFAILGPEVFASADGQTISWQGANYSRHPGEIHCMCGGIGVTHAFGGGVQPAAQEGSEGPCGCGEPSAPGTVHRTDGSCYVDEFSYEERERTGRNAGLCIHPDGYDGECPCPPSCTCCQVATRTTPDNPATSSDTTDNPLREQVAAALSRADEHSCQMQDGVDYPVLAAAVVDAILPTTRLLGALARSADADVKRVIDLYERWVKAGPPPLGTSMSRWWDGRLVELHDAILPPQDQPAAHDGGPSVAECTQADRAWPLQREGE